MTLSPNGSQSAPGVVIRQPGTDEIARVIHLFRNTRLRPQSRLIVAEKIHPLPRFVAAAAWWPEGSVGRFLLACQPAYLQGEVIANLIDGVLAAAREVGLESAQFADLLPDGSAWLQVLEAHGFERTRSERSFEILYRDAWTRVMRLYERHRKSVPPTWRTKSIREHRPEEIFELVAPHRLLPPEELRHYWQVAATAGFDLDMSCILFDLDRPLGAFLARRIMDVFYVDVQVVREPNPRLRSLADLCMLYHGAALMPPEGPLRWIRFRSGETEHRQTGNLALRMGGREVGRTHVLGKRLNS